MRRYKVATALLRLWLVTVMLFMVSPLFFVLVNSFNSSPFSSFPPQGLSLRWYQDALNYEPFQTGLRNSLTVAIGATAIALTAGTMAALALIRYRFRGRDALRTLFVSPMVFPKVALGLAAFVLFLKVAEVLQAREALLSSPISLIVVHGLIGLPLVVVIVSSALIGVDPTIEEAAADLGADPSRTFFRVTLPLIRQGLIIAGFFAFMFSFDEVESAIFLAPIAGRTLPVEMFLFLERRQDPTLAALSALLVVTTLIIVVALASRYGVERITRAVNRA
jgi:putative spermidine/putrescine transport system permease protein